MYNMYESYHTAFRYRTADNISTVKKEASLFASLLYSSFFASYPILVIICGNLIIQT